MMDYFERLETMLCQNDNAGSHNREYIMHKTVKYLKALSITSLTIMMLYLTVIKSREDWSAFRVMPFEASDPASQDIYFRKVRFNKDGSDVFVDLHIQKTGGSTFEFRLLHLLDNMTCKHPGNQPPSVINSETSDNMLAKDCLNSRGESWIFSRKTSRWGCGMHPDYSTLRSCVPGHLNEKEGPRNRRYHYFTILRNPVLRYLSEWLHVSRGAKWLHAALTCNYNKSGHYLYKTGICNWPEMDNITLDVFMNCPFNMATNRQTWMLADVAKYGCEYLASLSPEARDALLLHSAKENLLKLSFFGLTEYQEETQFLFERTFSLKFLTPIEIRHQKEKPEAETRYNEVIRYNSVDRKLYEFAKRIFFSRLRRVGL